MESLCLTLTENEATGLPRPVANTFYHKDHTQYCLYASHVR